MRPTSVQRASALIPGLIPGLVFWCAAGLIPAPGQAQETDEDLKGVYAPIEISRKERNDLIDTADQYHDLFQRRSLLYTEPTVIELVRRVGHDIAPPATDAYITYEFHVIRDPSPNAFALPNGNIYVHTGMLARLTDESQLAALLGHEIAHVAGHHSLLNYRHLAKRVMIDVLSGGLGSLMGQLRYSRQLEQEADDRSAVYLADSGYDVHGMTDVLEILDTDFEGLDPRYASIWVSHPDPQTRIANSRQLLADYPHRERDPGQFNAAIFPLRALTLRDYIQDDFPYTAIALAETYIEHYPDALEFRMVLGDAQRLLGPRPSALPEDFTKQDARRNLRDRIRNSRSQRMDELLATPEGVAAMAANLAQARETFDGILADNPEYWPAYRGLGDVYSAEGNPREAARAWLTYVREQPDALDRPIIIDRLTAIRDQLATEEGKDD